MIFFRYYIFNAVYKIITKIVVIVLFAPRVSRGKRADECCLTLE